MFLISISVFLLNSTSMLRYMNIYKYFYCIYLKFNKNLKILKSINWKKPTFITKENTTFILNQNFWALKEKETIIFTTTVTITLRGLATQTTIRYRSNCQGRGRNTTRAYKGLTGRISIKLIMELNLIEMEAFRELRMTSGELKKNFSNLLQKN